MRDPENDNDARSAEEREDVDQILTLLRRIEEGMQREAQERLRLMKMIETLGTRLLEVERIVHLLPKPRRLHRSGGPQRRR